MRVRYLLVAVGLAACSTDDGGNGTMTATINGVTWRPDKVTGTRTKDTISVGGKSAPFPIVTIDGTGIVGPGAYRVTNDIFATPEASFSVLDQHGFVLTQIEGTGALVINTWSDVQVDGRFSFTAGHGSSLHSVSGMFTIAF